jgi:hypothetical protein
MKNSEKLFEVKAEYDFSRAVRGRFYQPKKYPPVSAWMTTFFCTSVKKGQRGEDWVPDPDESALRDWKHHHQD